MEELNWTILAGCKILLEIYKLMLPILKVKYFFIVKIFWFPFFSSCIDFIEWELMEPRVPVTIEARLGYKNKGDPDDEWKEYATSTESRTMDCSPPEVIFFVMKGEMPN